MMRGKRWIGLLLRTAIVLGVLTLSIMAIGSVSARQLGTSHLSAGSPNPEKYCTMYEQSLASKLHVSVAQLDAARASALRSVIQRAYSDGALTKTQEQNLLAKLNKYATNPCAAVGRIAATHQTMAQVFANARPAIVTAVADALNMPAATLESNLSSGETIPMIAAKQHVSIDVVNTAYLGAVHTALQTAVGNRTITQDQADSSYAAFQRAVNNGVYPLLRPHK